MTKRIMYYLPILVIFINACSNQEPDAYILVKGGPILNSRSYFYENGVSVSDFYIGKYEVTQKEWYEIMGYNPSQFKGDSLPVEMVSWYECIEFCNQKSKKEGLIPYYLINKNQKDTSNKNELDDIKWLVTIQSDANGYRLPTEKEWEYAASGGHRHKGYIYSGGDNITEVAWFWQNAGDKLLSGNWNWDEIEKNQSKTKPIGEKKPNELGLYDMSGNVREWCWDMHNGSGTYDPQGRVWKGGGWIGAEFCCETIFRGSHQANGKGPDQGFRVCRNK